MDEMEMEDEEEMAKEEEAEGGVELMLTARKSDTEVMSHQRFN